MQHSFDISIAQKYGVNVALFLNNVAFWIHKNLANNRHYNDGYHWTYNSQEAFLKLFPYWTRQNLRTVIKKTIDEDLIKIGNYNETKYDRTGWYAFTERGLDLFPTLKSLGCNQPINSVKPTTSLVGTNQPIPDSNTDIKPERERKPEKPLSKSLSKPKDQKPFEPDEESAFLCSDLKLDMKAELDSFAHRHKGEKNQYEFQRWLKNSYEYKNRNANKANDKQRNEPCSTVPIYGPGHPHWEMMRKYNMGSRNNN